LPETTVTAIVLRRSDSGENDRRLTLFTRELGKIEAIAKGARKGGSRLAGVSEPLTVAELQIAIGRVRNFVTQAQPVSSLPNVRTSYERILCGQALAELVAVHYPFTAPHPEAFDDLFAALSALGGDGGPAVPLVWFAAHTLAAEGPMPDWAVCAVTGTPLSGPEVWYSPAAGGSVGRAEAEQFHDSARASREAMIAISKTAPLAAPPPRLKRAAECSEVLFRTWQGVLDAPLPAWEAAVRSMKGSGV
jgi:DNA repair protein RecO (recombination protein O)